MKDNLLTRLYHAVRPQSQSNDLPIVSLRAESFQSLRTLTHYANDQYENGYSSIRAIANRFMVIRTTAIDENGKPAYAKSVSGKTLEGQSPNVINVLSRPNSDMSGIDFRDALAVMTMVHDKVYILVHEKYGQETRPATEAVTEDTVAGFTFLENVVEENVGNGPQYRVSVLTAGGTVEPRIYFPYQVIVMHDVNPTNLSNGYSPSRAAKRWTRIDDYIADYEAGFFENGAVPSGQFLITAPTTKEYDDIVDGLESKHKGAGKNGNVVYTYQPIDTETGKPAQASITWVPFNTSNKDLALKDLFEQANKKIDSVYGVSAFIRAIDEAPNYATAQVIERNFVENTVRPFAIKKWARFQHELNRIVGGLGYGITFLLLTPHIAEEEKNRAETKNITVQALKTLTDQGYTLESSVMALELPPSFKLLKKSDNAPVITTDDDNPDVDEDDEVEDSPTAGAGGSKRKNPKVSNQLTPEDITRYEAELQAPPRALMQKQVDRAIDTLDPQDVDTAATEDDKDVFVDEMMVIISGILLYAGTTQWEEGRNLIRAAGIDPPSTAYELTDSASDRYRKYLRTVVDSYSSDTTASIRAVLQRAFDEDWTRAESEAAIRNIMNTDAWRVTRISTSEINRSGGIASVEAMIKIEDDSEATIEKSMMTGGANPCEFCLARVDKWFPVKKTMVKKGEIVTGVDGGTFVNNWDNNAGHDIHANGACYPIYRVV